MRIRQTRRSSSAGYGLCSRLFGTAHRLDVWRISARDFPRFVTTHGRLSEHQRFNRDYAASKTVMSHSTRMRLITLGTAALVVVLVAQPGRSQTPLSTADAHVAAPPATLIYANRPIVEFRATVLGRTPAERAAAAAMFIDRIVETSPDARVTIERVGDAVTVHIGAPAVFAILPMDVDTLAGETLEGVSAATEARLQRAFDEAGELRQPRRLLRAGLLALVATFVYAGLLWLVRRGHRATAQRLNRTTERHLQKLTRGADILRASHLPEILKRAIDAIALMFVLVISYPWLTFLLRSFPYTRPWGESLRTVLVTTSLSIGRRVLDSLPDLLMVLTIVVITRFVVRLSNYLFDAIEHERVVVRGVYPETAQPTRRIVAVLLWLLALVVAYPYLPGSGTDAFKGVSVFIGVIVSLGSSGIMNQIMSGLTITYSRALGVGDFVKIGEIEGTVEHLGFLSLKIKTERRESITIPNALVVSTSTINYSRFAAREGVQVSTKVTIGYDTPWRQVEALLILAANRSPGVRKEPPPVVRQTGLLDFYVQYTLLVCLDQPRKRGAILHALHANILDAFNEYGVQITSPNYEADPDEAKVVPRSKWYAAPAAPAAGPPTQAGRGTAA
jgi:small-conductance mechanosensitive channel